MPRTSHNPVGVNIIMLALLFLPMIGICLITNKNDSTTNTSGQTVNAMTHAMTSSWFEFLGNITANSIMDSANYIDLFGRLPFVTAAKILGIIGGITGGVIAVVPPLRRRTQRAWHSIRTQIVTPMENLMPRWHTFFPNTSLPIIDPAEVEHRIAHIKADIALYTQMLEQSPYARAREINAKIAQCEALGIDLTDKIENRDWFCPILRRLMAEPIKAPDGHYFERSALQAWYDGGARQAILNAHLRLENPRRIAVDLKLQISIANKLDEILRETHTIESGSAHHRSSSNHMAGSAE